MSATEFDARHYWDKRLKRNWSLHGVGMVRLAHSYNRWLYRVRDRVFRRVVRTTPLDVASSTVLDIGSGTGFYIDLWRKLGSPNVSGADIADSAVSRLRKKFPEVRFEQMDLSEEPPFQESAFDAISAFDVLFHIVDDDRYQRAIDNVHRLLAPGGWFVFSENFVPEKRKGRKHYVSRSRDEIHELLRRSGFEIVSRAPMFELMTPPVASARRWRWNLWSKRILPAVKRERVGNVVGAALYPVELLLTRFLRRSSSIEVVVCRKPADSQ